jgi:hypothetical protein
MRTFTVEAKVTTEIRQLTSVKLALPSPNQIDAAADLHFLLSWLLVKLQRVGII